MGGECNADCFGNNSGCGCGVSSGRVSFAVVVSKGLYHQDVRRFGSGNAGMTNILRTYGKKAAALTLAGDFLKGIAAVVIGRLIFAAMG